MTITDAQVGAAMNAVVTYYEAQGHTVQPESVDFQALRAGLEAALEPATQRVRLTGPGWSKVGAGEDWRFREVTVERNLSGEWFFREGGSAWRIIPISGPEYEITVVPPRAIS